MRPEDESELVRTAGQIADGVPVDWSARVLETPALDRPLAGMRTLESIVSVHRALLEPARAGVAPLFGWGPFRVLEKLGEGSYGEVYRAWEPSLQRDVALKLRHPVPRADASGTRRWLEEARRLARVRHPNVVTVLGAEVHAGRPGLWTELLRGQTLEEMLRARGPLGAHETAALGIEICRGLAAVHAAGLVHGDLTSANVMRVGEPGGVEGAGRIVLTDFGAAVERGRRSATAITPLFCAPELLRGGPPSEAADIYALGVLLYRLVTSAYPLDVESFEGLRGAHERGAYVPLRDRRADLPRGFVAAVERALAPDPAQRFTSAGAVESALVASLEDTPGPSPPVGAPPVAAPPSPRRGRVILLAGVAALAAVFLLFVRGQERLARDPEPTRDDATFPAAPGRAASGQDAPAAVGNPGEARAPAAPSAGIAAPQVEAVLYRGTGAGVEPLANGGLVRPGNRLFLDFGSREPLHAYVLDEDAEGHVFVLFPVAGLDLANPLPAGEVRLPGTRGGAPLDWQVTSAGGRETILIVAARSPVATLESAVARMPRAVEGRPVAYAELDEQALRALRGVGGLVPGAPAEPASGALAELAHTLARRAQQRGDLWIRQITLENPVP